MLILIKKKKKKKSRKKIFTRTFDLTEELFNINAIKGSLN